VHAAAAVVGERCAYEDRVGLVQILARSVGASAWAVLHDVPDFFTDGPDLSDASCSYYSFASGSCGSCEVPLRCGADGECHEPRQADTSLELVLASESEEQLIPYDPSSGAVSGSIALSDPSFSVELRGFGQRVTHVAASVPGELTDLNGTMSGTYDEPTAIDVSWSPEAAGTHVFTHVPMNHHVPTGAFTECAVDATVGAMHIDDSMLVPLSVSTGLEFQTVDHTRFAAAETPLGCIEFRWTRLHYSPLRG